MSINRDNSANRITLDKNASPHTGYRGLRFIGNSPASQAAYNIYYGLTDIQPVFRSP